jgi:hypothetical protein
MVQSHFEELSSQLIMKYPTFFTEPKGSLLFSQEPATVP